MVENQNCQSHLWRKLESCKAMHRVKQNLVKLSMKIE